MRPGSWFRRRRRRDQPTVGRVTFVAGCTLLELQVCEGIARLYRDTGTVWVPFGYDLRPGPGGAISISCPSGMTFQDLGW